MARKEPTFTQLYDYITREGDFDPRFVFTQNFILRDREAILKEFENNANLLSKRSNGNYLYHEIISITRAKSLSEDKQKEMLKDIVAQYSKGRGKDCLVFGGLHDEKDDNLHFHLIISANKQGEANRHWLKKSEFNKVKVQVEEYTLQRYPELGQAKLISKKFSDKEKMSQKEFELKRRTGKASHKDVFKDKLKTIFEKSADKQAFFDNLEKAQIEIYTRGKTIGFLDVENNRKHRLKTLGLVAEFEQINSTLSKTESSKEKDQEKKEQPKQTPKKEPKKAKATQEKATPAEKPKSKPTTKTKPKKKTATKDKKDKKSTFENIKETVADVGKEWIFGDFSKRDERIKEEKQKEKRKTYTKVVPDEKMTTADKAAESFKKWVFGNFSASEARIRMKNWQDKHDKEQAEIDNTKDREDQTTFENVRETAKEWIMGDFKARENRTKKAEQEKANAKWKTEQQKERDKKAKQAEKAKENEPPNKARDDYNKDIQNRREAIDKMRTSINKSRSKDKGKDKGRSR